jgi:anti-sigma factor ChrR (cupin superfamily)
MRGRNALAFVASFAVAAAVSAQGSGQTTTKDAPKTGKAAVIVPAADLKWTDLDPAGAPGVKSADVWGDHTKGAFGGFTKFPAGFVAPLHTHTNEMKIAVISGTFIHTPEGKAEVRLGPGSYLMQPGGNYRHTTACDKASECLFFIQSNGKFDIIPVAAETEKK